MRTDNLLGLRRRAFVPVTTDSRHGWRVVPNLARGIELTGLDQLWVADVTYLRLLEEFAFLAVVLDAFSRRVIGWAVEIHLKASHALAALRMALAARRPRPGDLIHHSDRGVQYACGDYSALLAVHGIQPSMSRIGSPHDNAKAESFMKTLKQEEVDGRAYRDGFRLDYRFDFEWDAYSSVDGQDRFLDLLVYTDPLFKVAMEFKFPKRSGMNPSAHTHIRALMCRDISRLSYLVKNRINDVRLGYFLCATEEGAYLSEGRKHVNPQYKTYQGTTYPAGCLLPKGEGRNGIDRELVFPNHEIRFDWEGVQGVGAIEDRLRPTGGFAWLRPIRVSG